MRFRKVDEKVRNAVAGGVARLVTLHRKGVERLAGALFGEPEHHDLGVLHDHDSVLDVRRRVHRDSNGSDVRRNLSKRLEGVCVRRHWKNNKVLGQFGDMALDDGLEDLKVAVSQRGVVGHHAREQLGECKLLGSNLLFRGSHVSWRLAFWYF
jgi:hypothetical protein